jgi:hypothetical protein
MLVNQGKRADSLCLVDRSVFRRLGSAHLGIVFYCTENAVAGQDHLPFMAPGTGGGIIATGVLMWLSGAISLSLEH